MKEDEKKRIAPTLREMMVGGHETFPKERYTSVLVTIQRLQFEMGSRWSVRRGKDMLTVTRTA